MSRWCDYSQFDCIKVKDYEGLFMFLQKNDCHKDLVKFHKHEELEKDEIKRNKIIRSFVCDYSISLGCAYKDDDGNEELDQKINHFHPETGSGEKDFISEEEKECGFCEDNVSGFLCGISKYLEDYDIVVWDEEFPTIPSLNGSAWRLHNVDGILTITELELIEKKKVDKN